MHGNSTLYIDTSDFTRRIEELRKSVTPEQANKCLFYALKETATRMRTPIARDIRTQYNAKHGDLVKAMGSPWISSTKCVLNIRFPRLKISPRGIRSGEKPRTKEYFMNGHHYNGRKMHTLYFRKAVGVKAKIVKGAEENLPTTASSGRPHYIINSTGQVVVKTGTYIKHVPFQTVNATAKKYPSTKTRFAPAVGVGIPSMPMTRAKELAQNTAHTLLQERLDAAIGRFILGKKR